MPYCTHCGNKTREEAKFCSICGQKKTADDKTVKSEEAVSELSEKPKNHNTPKTSGFWRRLGAYLIDMVLASTTGGIIAALIFGSHIFYGDFGNLTSRLLALLFLILYSFIFLSFFSTSPGKALYGLTVVDIETRKKLSWKQSLKRSLGYIGSGILFGYGFWKAAFNKERRTWHDELAGTIVLQKNTYWMVAGVILTIAAVIFLGYSYSDEANSKVSANWQQFNSTEGHFKIDFPVYPEKDESKVNISGNDLNLIQYTGSLADGTTYIAQYVEFSSQFKLNDSKTILNDAVNGSVESNKNNKLVSSTYTTFHGLPSIDFSIYNSKEKAYMSYKNILSGQKLYTIGAVSFNEKILDYDKFINSFQLF